MRPVNRRTPALILLVEDDRGDRELVWGWLWQGTRSEASKSIFHAFIR